MDSSAFPSVDGGRVLTLLLIVAGITLAFWLLFSPARQPVEAPPAQAGTTMTCTCRPTAP